jgi:5-methylcytosine-specific restriction endonuclease McrA
MKAELPTKELYAIFLESQWWRDLSSFKRRSVGKCERCGSKKHLQSHHKVYRQNWFDTEPGDLEVLCRNCHNAEHGKYPKKRRCNPAGRPFSGQLAKVRKAKRDRIRRNWSF